MLLAADRLSVPDNVPDNVARLGVSRGYPGRTLAGYVPARESDIILRCWFLGEKRRSYDPVAVALIDRSVRERVHGLRLTVVRDE
ncbi:MAG: hypothetical protein ACRDWE_09570 [Acidimicrobiales bacterium]